MLSAREVKEWPPTVPFTRTKTSLKLLEMKAVIEWYGSKLRLDVSDPTVIPRIRIMQLHGSHTPKVCRPKHALSPSLFGGMCQRFHLLSLTIHFLVQAGSE